MFLLVRSTDFQLPNEPNSPRFLLLRRVDVVHVGLEARERRRREAELGREGLEPRRGGDRHRFLFLFFSLLFVQSKSREKE